MTPDFTINVTGPVYVVGYGTHWQNQVLSLLNQLLSKELQMAATLDQVVASIQEETTVDDSLIVLTTGIKKQLDDVLSGVTIPPAAQAKVDAIFNAVEANKAKVAAAVTANTPVAPTPPTP